MINVLAVIVAAILSMIIGMIWYGPLFGKKWMTLSGIKMDKKNMKMPIMNMVIQLVASIVMFSVLAYFISGMPLMPALVATIVIWFGFSVATSVGSVIWENKPLELYILNIAHNFVVFLVGAGAIAMMG
ncbi:DUF1761 domain-containing protein [Candidatus Micrarchaeota archaeon]|nr:DUF1761 domain-containing protein [Candidatus Micrarchaeota archaeon]